MAWLPGGGVMDPGESALQISFIWEYGDNNMDQTLSTNSNKLAKIAVRLILV